MSNEFNTAIIEDILAAKNSYNGEYGKMPTHMLINKCHIDDIKHFFKLIVSPPQINYYDETDELNHRFHSMKIKFVEMNGSFILFDKDNIINTTCQQFLEDLELSYVKNAEDYRISVYSANQEALKGQTVEIDALELYNVASFLHASRKLFDEGRLPHRVFEDTAFHIAELMLDKIDKSGDLKHAPGLDYKIFDMMYEQSKTDEN